VAALVDTNVPVYRFDSRFAAEKKIATEVLGRGIMEDSVRLPHQAIVEIICRRNTRYSWPHHPQASGRFARSGRIPKAASCSVSE
jgi:hypothetical protein